MSKMGKIIDYKKSGELIVATVRDEQTTAEWTAYITPKEFAYRIWKQKMQEDGKLTEKEVQQLSWLVEEVITERIKEWEMGD